MTFSVPNIDEINTRKTSCNHKISSYRIKKTAARWKVSLQLCVVFFLLSAAADFAISQNNNHKEMCFKNEITHADLEPRGTMFSNCQQGKKKAVQCFCRPQKLWESITLLMLYLNSTSCGGLLPTCFVCHPHTSSALAAKGPRMKVQFDLNATMLQKLKWLQWQSESAARHGLFTVCKCTRGFVYANVVL